MTPKHYRVCHKVTVEYIRYVTADTAKIAEELAADMGDTEGDQDSVTMTAWKAKVVKPGDYDALEVGALYRIMFSDEECIDAWPEEIDPSLMAPL